MIIITGFDPALMLLIANLGRLLWYYSHRICPINPIFWQFTFHATKTLNLISPDVVSVVQYWIMLIMLYAN